MEAKNPLNILITTAGGIEKYELVTRLLEEHYSEYVGNIVAVDAQENVITEQYQSENGRLTFERVPYSNDPQFLQSLNTICNLHGIDIIFSIDTEESILLANEAKNYNYLKRVKLTCSDTLDSSIHLNKFDYFTSLEQAGHDFVGPFNLISDPSSSRNINKFQRFTKLLPLIHKYVLKPNNSHGSRGLKIVDLLFQYSNYENSRDPYFVSDREMVEMMVTSKGSFFVQPFYSGFAYNIDCYLSNQNILYTSIQKLPQTSWGQVLGSEVLKQTDPIYKEIYEIAGKIATTLKLNKNFNFEVRECPEYNKLFLVEINPRISAVYPQSMLTEVNLPLISILDALNLLEDKPHVQTKKVYLSSVLTTVISYDEISEI